MRFGRPSLKAFSVQLGIFQSGTIFKWTVKTGDLEEVLLS